MAAKLVIAGGISLAAGIVLFGVGMSDPEARIVSSVLASVGATLVALSWAVQHLASAIRVDGDATREEIWRLRGMIDKGEEHEKKPPES